MDKITLNVPTKDTPGFARRMYRATQFQASLKDGVTSELVIGIIDFLAEYITCEDESKKKDLLWDLSENQFNELLTAVYGGGANESPLSPPPNPEPIVTP